MFFFQFLLGCYAFLGCWFCAFCAGLSIPFRMLPPIHYSPLLAISTALSIPFRMLQGHAQRGPSPSKRLSIPFRMLRLGVFRWSAQSNNRLSIPFRMLPTAFPLIFKTLTYSFNSFQDATVGNYQIFIIWWFGFQFLLGCYLRRLASQPAYRGAFNSFQDATEGKRVERRCPYCGFQFLLGCYTWHSRYGLYSAMLTFNSFQDATH